MALQENHIGLGGDTAHCYAGLMNHATTLYIDNAAALAELCAQLRRASWIALDTEFVREKTFYPRLCLVQLASDELLACVDPFAVPGLDPLVAVLYDEAITKVMHAARQDMEIFYHQRGELPRPVFDTQLAAPLLGLKEQMGYASLVEALLGVKLDKAHTRADWSQRPLSAAQLQYAVDDVRYLAALYPLLRDQLEAKGRLNWLDADFSELSDPRLYASPPADAWLRIKGMQRLRPRQLAVAQALAAWREETAQRLDKPRSWILHEDSLLDLARLQPNNKAELAQLRGLHEQTAARHGEAILQVIADAQGRAPIPLPPSYQPLPLGDAQEAVVDLLLAAVRKLAAEQAIHPNLVAGRKEVERLVTGDVDISLLHGWRRQMAGDTLLAILRGKAQLRVQHGEVCIITNSNGGGGPLGV